jgi:hypothetical protein
MSLRRLPFVLAMAIVTTMLVLQTKGWLECNHHGGTYVKGAFWYKCIEQKH